MWIAFYVIIAEPANVITAASPEMQCRSAEGLKQGYINILQIGVRLGVLPRSGEDLGRFPKNYPDKTSWLTDSMVPYESYN